MQHTDSWQKITKYLSILETRHVKPEGSLSSLSLSRKERINSARYIFTCSGDIVSTLIIEIIDIFKKHLSAY